jgi:hypothetical protein
VIEIAALVVATVGAFLVRRGGLPTDGLWFDDAWVAAGAIHGHLTQIMTVGSGHPGFTALLMGWHQLDHSLGGLAIPALLAGTITPALLYLSLRDAHYERSISALLAAVVAVSWLDILYSARVKPYTLDPVLVLCLGLALHRLVRVEWRWRTATLWTVSAVALGCFSGFVLMATAAAGLVLFLHPVRDRAKRAAGVGAQAILQFAFLHSTNLTAIENHVQHLYDPHLTFHANPITFGTEILTHLRRIAQVYPGGSGIWLTVLALTALAGLAVAALRPGRSGERIWSRYLLIMLVGSFIGALKGQFPFGPIVHTMWSSGARYMLWVIPVMAFGLAATFHRVQRYAVRQHVPRSAIDALVGAAAVVVVVAGLRTPTHYQLGGSQTAARYADSVLRPGDLVIVSQNESYALSDSTDLPVTLRPTPTHEIGFTPVFGGTDVHVVGGLGGRPSTTRDFRMLTEHAHRVVVITGDDTTASALRSARSNLQGEGFHIDQHQFGTHYVLVASR